MNNVSNGKSLLEIRSRSSKASLLDYFALVVEALGFQIGVSQPAISAGFTFLRYPPKLNVTGW
jgi:hypothetical protein